MKFFEGCTALVTGASAGLGAEFARQLAPYAHTLVIAARRNDRLEELRQELLSVNPSLTVFPYQVDLSSPAEVDRFAKWLDEQGIRINFLINNAGLGDHGWFEASDWNRIKAMIEVNITALTRLTHALLPGMRSSGRGAILNVSSIASLLPLPHSAVYAATKAYVTSFTEALRMELRGSGITVSAVLPGPVDTEFFEVATRPGEEPWSARRDAPDVLVVPASQVVAEALYAVAQDRPRVIPGLLVCIAMTFTALVPLFILRGILAWRSERIH